MKVQHPAGHSTPPTAEELIAQLQGRVPYKMFARTKSIVVVEKSAATGATILIGKKALNVQAAFPSMGLQMVFILVMIGLGILIPLVLYFLTLYRGQKAVETEVVAALNGLYAGSAGVGAGSPG
jgi:hypothetical protein